MAKADAMSRERHMVERICAVLAEIASLDHSFKASKVITVNNSRPYLATLSIMNNRTKEILGYWHFTTKSLQAAEEFLRKVCRPRAPRRRHRRPAHLPARCPAHRPARHPHRCPTHPRFNNVTSGWGPSCNSCTPTCVARTPR